MKRIHRSVSGAAIFAAFTFALSSFAGETLEERFETVLPSEDEQAWREVGWQTNLMVAREEAQKRQRPIFLWIMVGNPHGCT
ncbi:MAG TPA: hypothetical protein PK648_08890 [Verrucomicrobiales bacterium]|nr:hypothetical protein [Verrucomicrobiales bacterium]